MVRDEVNAAIAPFREQVEQLQMQSDVLRRLSAALGPTRVAQVRGRTGHVHTCAIIGCDREERSKGYCSAHYQKRRMLARTKRLPSAWVENAKPQSVQNVVLPRGRPAPLRQ